MHSSFVVITVVMTMRLVICEKKDLNIMGFFPMTGKVFRGGKACLLGADMALRHINGRDDFLEQFNLNLIWRDSKVILCVVIFHLNTTDRAKAVLQLLLFILACAFVCDFPRSSCAFSSVCGSVQNTVELQWLEH